MKLRQIISESGEYGDLEDADKFGTSEEMVSVLRLAGSIAWQFAMHRMFRERNQVKLELYNILKDLFGNEALINSANNLTYEYNRPITHTDLDNAHNLMQYYEPIKKWWDKWAKAPERLDPDYGKGDEYLDHLHLNEDYEELEDEDEFYRGKLIAISGRLPWAYCRDPKPVVAEVERLLDGNDILNNARLHYTDEREIKDGHGGHTQWDIYLIAEYEPYDAAKRFRKQVKRNNYKITVPSGDFIIDNVMVVGG